MPKIIFVKPDQSEHTIVVENGTTVMEAGRDANLGIEGTCGGCLSCATCHVIINPAWFAKTGLPSEDEADMLIWHLAWAKRLGWDANRDILRTRWAESGHSRRHLECQ